jgi:hypothetical protein
MIESCFIVDLINFCLTVFLGVTIATISGIILYKYTRTKIQCFNGRLTADNLGDFVDFIDVNEDKVFFIDINLEREKMEELTGVYKQFGYYNVLYETPSMGVIFDFSACSDFLYIDSRQSSNRIKGYLKIVYSGGPHIAGNFLYKFKDVELEKNWMNKQILYKPKKKDHEKN